MGERSDSLGKFVNANSGRNNKGKKLKHMNMIREIIRTVLWDSFGLGNKRAATRRVTLNQTVRICAVLCAAIAVTGSIARADWTQFRFDQAHHGVNRNETILSPDNVADLTVKWRTNIG